LKGVNLPEPTLTLDIFEKLDRKFYAGSRALRFLKYIFILIYFYLIFVKKRKIIKKKKKKRVREKNMYIVNKI